MKVAIITSVLISGVSSFAPSVRPGYTTSTQLRMADYENALGAQKPLGFWDPLDMVTNKPQEVFDDLRLKEIKHGRAAMLAVVGNLYTLSGARLPGGLGSGDEVLPFNEIPAGIDALKTIPQAGLLQIIAFIGFLDVVVMQDKKGKAEFPGDLRNGFDFGWSKLSEEEKLSKRAIELNNGRAAQMGILALVVHNYLGNLDLIIPDPHYYVGSV